MSYPGFKKLDRIISERLTQVDLTSSRSDEFKSVSLLGSIQNIAVWGIESPVKNVLLERVIEEQGLLLHESKSLTKLANVHLPDIDAINEHLAKLWIVKAHDQANEGWLALAWLTNNGNVVFLIDLKIETLEDPLLQFCGIAEPNIFELNLSFEVLSINVARFLGLILNTFNPLYFL